MANVYIKTFGCSANQAESEIMAGLLEESGNHAYHEESGIGEADAILVNVCSVKGDKKALKEIQKFHGQFPNKKLIVGGCVTSSMLPKIEKIAPDASIINTDNIKSVVDVVSSQAKLKILDRKKEIKVSLPRIRQRNMISIVPISQGCTSFCTYCSTKQNKGNIFSYPQDKIVKEIKDSIKEGCKEVFLTSQDNGDYGYDLDRKCHLPELLDEISKIKGDFWVRSGMTNPIGIMPVLDELISAFKHDKIYKFLHIPVQAGNDDVLKAMQRRYTVEDFKLLVKKFRKEIPEITLATDIICGFPGETEEQFNDTLRLVEEIKPDVVNISRFVAREGTAAFRMEKQIHGNKKKDRSTALSLAWKKVALQNNRKWIGWQGKILIDEIGKRGELIGRNYAYKPVVIEQGKNKKYKMGDYLKVKIVDATALDLRGKITHEA